MGGIQSDMRNEMHKAENKMIGWESDVRNEVSKYEKRLCDGKRLFPSNSWGFLYRWLTDAAKIAFFVLVSLSIVYFSRRKLDGISIAAVAILTLMFYLIFMLTTHSYLGNALPFATYPLPPHLGLDGVSNEVRSSY